MENELSEKLSLFDSEEGCEKHTSLSLPELNSKVKPCPFCGSESVSIAPYQNGSLSSISCNKCRCEGPLVNTDSVDVYKNALEGWNQRC